MTPSAVTALLETRAAPQAAPHRPPPGRMAAQNTATKDFNQTLLAHLEEAEPGTADLRRDATTAENDADTLPTTETPLPPVSSPSVENPYPGQSPAPQAYAMHGTIGDGKSGRPLLTPSDGVLGNAATYTDATGFPPGSAAARGSAQEMITTLDSYAEPMTPGRLPGHLTSIPSGTNPGSSTAHAVTQVPSGGSAQGIAGEITGSTEDVSSGQREATPLSPLQNEALSGLSYAGSTAPSPGTEPVPVHHATLRSHPNQAAFHPELAAEVRVLVKDGLQHAQLQLHPTELGPILIDIRVENQIADIRFSVHHTTTRDSISQSMEQLRDMLAGEGLGLGQTHVGTGAHPQNPGRGPGSEPAWTMAKHQATEVIPTHATDVPRRVVTVRGMLDVYA